MVYNNLTLHRITWGTRSEMYTHTDWISKLPWLPANRLGEELVHSIYTVHPPLPLFKWKTPPWSATLQVVSRTFLWHWSVVSKVSCTVSHIIHTTLLQMNLWSMSVTTAKNMNKSSNTTTKNMVVGFRSLPSCHLPYLTYVIRKDYLDRHILTKSSSDCKTCIGSTFSEFFEFIHTYQMCGHECETDYRAVSRNHACISIGALWIRFYHEGAHMFPPQGQKAPDLAVNTSSL